MQIKNQILDLPLRTSIMIVVFVWLTIPANAQTASWNKPANAGFGAYNTAANWNVGGGGTAPPNTTTNVFVDNGGEARVSTTSFARSIIVGDTLLGSGVSGSTLSFTGAANLQSTTGGAGSAVIGNQAGGIGIVNVNAGTWTNGSFLQVGNAGTGTMTIQNTGVVSSNFAAIGVAANGTGTVTVTGSGASWTNQSFLTIGASGTGVMTVSSGGTVSNTSGFIGSSLSGVGTVNVTGTNSTWTATALTVGNAGTGTLTIQGGGAVNNTTGIIGNGAASNGTVVVTGANSIWTNSSSLTVGEAGQGSLTISAGGSVSSLQGKSFIGALSGSTGTVIVTGTNSTLKVKDLQVGNGGAATLTIGPGGQLISGVFTNAFIGTVGGGGSATMNIDGGLWSNTGGGISLQDGAMNITNGGIVNDNLGAYIGGVGTAVVNVIGPGSTWSSGVIGGHFIMGNSGNGSVGVLNIQSGGTVNAGIVTIGSSAGSDAKVNVGGVGSQFTTSADLQIGQSGMGEVTISNGGTVVVQGDVDLATDLSATGKLNIGSGLGAGTLIANAVHANGMGNAIVNFNHNAIAYNFNPTVTGFLTVNQIGTGTTILKGSNTYTGTTNVNAGTLLINSAGDATGASSVNVMSGAVFGGGGTVSGATTVAGIVAPGLPGVPGGIGIGKLTFTNLTMQSGSKIILELVSAVVSIFDEIECTDTVALSGTLEIKLATGFSPGMNDSFDIFDWNQNNLPATAFDNYILPSLAQGLAWDTSALYTTGTLSVVPEPSAGILLMLGSMGGLIIFYRRRIDAKRVT